MFFIFTPKPPLSFCKALLNLLDFEGTSQAVFQNKKNVMVVAITIRVCVVTVQENSEQCHLYNTLHLCDSQ